MKPLYLLAERIQALAASSGLSELKFVEEALEIIRDWGFRSVRYYEVTDNPLTDSSTFILRHALYNRPDLRAELGLKIEMMHSTLTSPEHSIMFGSPAGATPGQWQWIRYLHLEDDQWADIALRDYEGNLNTLLAISKPKSARGFELDMDGLRAIQAAFQYFYLLHRLRQISSLSLSLHRALERDGSEDPLHVIVRNIARLIPARSVALFEYEWPTQQIAKRIEFIDGEFNADMVAESYVAGKGLTGRAWSDATCELIPDLESYCADRNITPHAGSMAFHEARLGPVVTLQYHKFGRGPRRFMVRLINRSDKPELPFNPTHAQALRVACEELAEYINEVTNKITLDHIQRLSRYGAFSGHNITRAIEIGVEALQYLGCTEPVLFYKKNRSTRLEILTAPSEDGFPDNGGADFGLGVNHSLRDWFNMSERDPVRDFLLTNVRAERDSVLTAFRAYGYRHAIGFLTAGEQGVIIAFVGVRRSDVSSYFRPAHDIDRAVLETILSILSILCSALEVSRSVMSVDDAEELMADFGHEVITPIAVMHSLAYESLNTAIRATAEAGEADEIVMLEENKREIDIQAAYIKQHMDVAKAFAQQSKGTLVVEFQRCQLRQIIDFAWEEAMEWRQDNLDQVSYRNVQLYRNDAVNRSVVIGDAGLLRNIFSNLFKNAIKYSFPKTEGMPIEVRVLAEPQVNMDIIHVENWGIGISSPMKEAIFGRFVREEHNDRVRAIRGRGVGLYFARTYAEVHNGELYCAHSVAEWNDPERISKLEGFRTCFDLRLPKYGRNIGTHTVSLNER